MNIGIPKERRPFEYRVGLPPAGVEVFTANHHTVYVEHGAGAGAGFADDDYAQAGATIVYSPDELYGRADLILKFARPMQEELELMPQGQTLAGFLHLAAARQDKIDVMRAKKLTAIAYEQVEDPRTGYRPILTPMSQIGGRMAAQVAARLLQNDHGGRGTLLGGVAGVPSAEVAIIGAGVVGSTAAASFAALGAHVTVLDVDLRKLQQLLASLPNTHLVTMLSTPYNLARACSYADVLIGAVLVPGERAPLVITRQMVASMKPRSVIIDMSIDQGGCMATSRPTHHGAPTYVDEGVIHYCVPNLSGVLGRTGTHALFNSAYPCLEAISNLGIDEAIQAESALERGINLLKGRPVNLSRLGGLGERTHDVA
jgi:alanine dehydrogenase